ncbi:site-specific integrase [Psychrobacter frigidicola]|uniref:site-specific integrase n=1 Tax=Psychrobacter frigidicola TaxID=45611 RepID=UPI001918A6F2|nr:site-specific integrase [Psychrobacter frigidicola]
MDNAVAHQLRQNNRIKAKEQIRHDAENLVADYIKDNPITVEAELNNHFHAINTILEESFDTPETFRLARQGFLKYIRAYNKTHKVQLDEPVVPVLAERDRLTIGYDWFVKGSEVSQASEKMIDIWQRKRKFSANDIVESIIYSSVMYGGLNDISSLRALYEWLFSEREVHKIQIPVQSNNSGSHEEYLALIPLAIDDDNYGCYPCEGSALKLSLDNNLRSYVEYIPDDMTLCFLYALKDKNLDKDKIEPFENIINNISKKLKLQNKDINKPHLSQLIKYANYHWRQMEGSQIDNALSSVKQGKIKSTGLGTNKLLDYNQEKINPNPVPLSWSELFNANYKRSIEKKGVSRNYPNFSKNLIKEIQDALKGTKSDAISQISVLQQEFTQPNAERLLGWVLLSLEDSSNRLGTISKYIGCIGRDWLMLTMDDDLNEWESEDFEEIYEQIIQSKIKDGRKDSVLCKESEFGEDNVSLNDDFINTLNDESEQNIVSDVAIESASNNKVSYLDKLKDTQKFTHGRLRAFHDYQREHYDAPYVNFPWGNNRQVVKANIVSPRIYCAMKEYLNSSDLELEQKRLCLVVLSLTYRTGMRINELIGIKVKDITDIYNSVSVRSIQKPRIILRPNRYRRLKSSSAKRVLPVDCLLKLDELELFIDLYHYQARLKRRYLFSQGSGDQPLPHIFFSNLMKLIWDRLLLDDHDFTFHSLRHTAVSQLAVVLSQSPLAQLLTDYDEEHCEVIGRGVLANNENQGAWFGLASFAGHLTCDTTFEYYIHTAHLLAGWQLSQAKLMLPLTVLQATTGINYQIVNRQDTTAYDATTKQVNLNKLRPYLIRKLADNKTPLLSNITGQLGKPHSIQKSEKNDLKKDSSLAKRSIFIHPKVYDVIALLEELQKLGFDKREKVIAGTAIRHGISIIEAKHIYDRAKQLFLDDVLLLGSPRGSENQKILIRTLDAAYQMSINNPENLRRFIEIFSAKQNIKPSSIHFGVKKSQLDTLKEFIDIGCQLIGPSHWQIRSDSEQAVRKLKKELELDSRIRIGSRENYQGFEVRVVQKKNKRSENNMAKTSEYYASSGLLKYLGYLLMVLVEANNS